MSHALLQATDHFAVTGRPRIGIDPQNGRNPRLVCRGFAVPVLFQAIGRAREGADGRGHLLLRMVLLLGRLLTARARLPRLFERHWADLPAVFVGDCSPERSTVCLVNGIQPPHVDGAVTGKGVLTLAKGAVKPQGGGCGVRRPTRKGN